MRLPEPAAPGLAQKFWVGVLGLALGFTLSRLGFTDYGELHAMLTLADLRLLFAFAGATALVAAGFAVMRGRSRLGAVSVHRGTVLGALVFGAGWAISGACPAVVFAQLGEGKLAALFTLAGIVAGTTLYAFVHRRYFRWDRGSCG